MAGSRGLKKGDRYDISVKRGEQVLLPAIGGTSPDVLVVADGFSCQTQIDLGHRVSRRALPAVAAGASVTAGAITLRRHRARRGR
ncbi:MAG: hypothetical protein ACRDZ9_05905 [Acidimicrobiales bacterium]